MYRATLEIVEKFNVRIKGIKLQLKCKKCFRLWVMWFESHQEGR